MKCEPRWGDGLSTSNSARVDRLSPHLVLHSLRESKTTRPLKGRVKCRIPHANFGCAAACAISLARSVFGQSSSSPSRPEAAMITALMVKPAM